MSFTIRKIDVTNALHQQMIATMHDEVFEEGEWTGRPAPTRGDWWIAFCGKEAAGFAGMVPSVRILNGGYLCRAGVLPKFRGQGLQKDLIRRRVAHARKLGWGTVVSDTISNPISSNSLISCGFRLFAPDIGWGNEGALYWRKYTGASL